MKGFEKASIADEDIPGWIEALKKDGPMTQEEIDFMLANLNKAYAHALNPNWIEEEIDQVDSLFFRHTGKRLTEMDKINIQEKLERDK
mgnify:FL=1